MTIETEQQEKIKPSEPFRYKKRHGSTTFIVSVYCNPDAQETVQDKIARMIRNEAEFVPFNDTIAEGVCP